MNRVTVFIAFLFAVLPFSSEAKYKYKAPKLGPKYTCDVSASLCLQLGPCPIAFVSENDISREECLSKLASNAVRVCEQFADRVNGSTSVNGKYSPKDGAVEDFKQHFNYSSCSNIKGMILGL